MFADSNYINCKVWKLYYDINQDLIYIFVAKIRQIKGKKLAKFHIEHKNMKSQKLVQYSNHQDAEVEYFDQSAKKSAAALEEQILQIYEDCEMEFQLVLQIWNIDDRIMKDREHR